MLSTHIVQNVTGASHYFTAKDNYYTQEEGVAESIWWGQSAEKLGLAGPVDPALFTALLQGKLPGGEQLGTLVEGEFKHRAGWDLTFSAPKSVSIVALIGGDIRLISAHREAVFGALAQIEKECSEVRLKTNQKMIYKKTHNLIAALFHHDLSRALDPQLHTHCVVMNITARLDGLWRSMASQRGRYDADANAPHGFIEQVRHYKRYFGKIYEAELAHRVKALGYAIEVDPETGVFEIASVPIALREQFSKRRVQIETSMDAAGVSGGRAAERATLQTRTAKTMVDRETLKVRWEQEAKNLGLDCKAYVQNIRDSKMLPEISENPVLPIEICAAILESAQELSIFKNTFTLESLLTALSPLAVRSGIPLTDLIKPIFAMMEAGEFLTVPSQDGKTHLMCKTTLEEEKRIVDCIKNNKPLENVSFYREKTLRKIKNLDVETELRAILDAKPFVLVEGERSKNLLLKPLLELLQDSNQNILCLSPNKITQKTNTEDFKNTPKSAWALLSSWFSKPTISHKNVQGFLNYPSTHNPSVILVDQSHLLSIQQWAKLLTFASAHHTKCIFLGRNHLLAASTRGLTLQQLIEQGLPAVRIPEIQNTKAAMVSEANIDAVMSHPSVKIIEMKDTKTRFKAMAEHFCRLTTEEKKTAFLLTARNNVVPLNLCTHQLLKSEGQLGASIEMTVLLPVFLSKTQLSDASHYQEGQTIRFHESQPGISKGEYLRVLDMDASTNSVRLENAKQKQMLWEPDSQHNVEVFSEVRREFCVGERLELQRSIKTQQLLKGERCEIKAIRGAILKLQTAQGKCITINVSKPDQSHWDYGYASTAHGLLHENPKILLADFPTHLVSLDQRRFFQSVAVAKTTWIYTDHLDHFRGFLEKNRELRSSAHETLASAHEAPRSPSVYEKLTPPESSTLSKAAVQALDAARWILSERQAAFSKQSLIETALKHAIGQVRPEELELALLAFEKAGVLLHAEKTSLWTTQEALSQEREIVALCHLDKNRFEPMASAETVHRCCAAFALTAEQRTAIQTIAQSKDRVLAIQGYAGTGKTSLLATLDQVLKAEGFELLTVAPTHNAVKELRERGLHAQTIDRFLIDIRRDQAYSQSPHRLHQVLVIDEASMVSNQKMLELLKIACDLQFRALIPTGDTRQLAAIEAGKPQALVQSQVDTLELKNIQRQKNPILKQAVQKTIDFNFKAAFQTLDNAIIEIPSAARQTREVCRQERLQTLVKDYFSYPVLERSHIQIITPGHDDRLLTNTLIRKELQKRGELLGLQAPMSILIPVPLTKTERTQASSFQAGQILHFTASASLIPAGSYCLIHAVDPGQGLLTLETAAGREVVWQVPTHEHQSVEVFTKEARNLQVGDQIRWSKSNPEHQLLSAELAIVKKIEAQSMTVQLANQIVLTMDRQDPKFQHWDYGYASTVYAVQGSKRQIVLAHLESFRTNLTHQSAFLVALTRAVDEFRIYTDNKRDLLQALESRSGMKYSALEVMGELEKKLVQKMDVEVEMNSKTAPPHKPKNQNLFDRVDLEKIHAGLNADAEKVATLFLGTPKVRGSNYLKFGRNQGSLSLTTQGPRQGFWYDFSEGIGGRSVLSLIQRFGNMSRQEALHYGARHVGIALDSPQKQDLKIRVIDTLARYHEPMQSMLDPKKIAYAEHIASETQPIAGTLGARYLREHRGIILEKYPDDIRFHPGLHSKLNKQTYPAVVVLARNSQGEIQAVQATFLDPETANKVDRSRIHVQKQTFGCLQGASVHIGPSATTVLVAEGTETGLSLAQALPHVHVQITLGKSNFVHLQPLQESHKVILCLDQDNKDFRQDRVIKTACKNLSLKGKLPYLMIPESTPPQKMDYNDVLKRGGVDLIQRDYAHAISSRDFYRGSEQEPSYFDHITVEKVDSVPSKLIQKTQEKIPQKDFDFGL